MKFRLLQRIIAISLLLAAALAAQGPPRPRPGPTGPPPPGRGGGPGIHLGPPGRWWDDAAMIQKLALTDAQRHAMDALFDAHRLELVDLQAAVEKQNLLLDPLLSADQPDEAQVMAQLDKLAQARADLEKADVRMLLGLRRQLSHDQWVKLQAERPAPGGQGPPRQPPPPQ